MRLLEYKIYVLENGYENRIGTMTMSIGDKDPETGICTQETVLSSIGAKETVDAEYRKKDFMALHQNISISVKENEIKYLNRFKGNCYYMERYLGDKLDGKTKVKVDKGFYINTLLVPLVERLSGEMKYEDQFVLVNKEFVNDVHLVKVGNKDIETEIYSGMAELWKIESLSSEIPFFQYMYIDSNHRVIRSVTHNQFIDLKEEKYV